MNAAQTDGFEIEHSGLIADEAGLEECKANVRARMATDTPARVEDVLIDEHNAPRPKFEAQCIRVTACTTLPIDAPLVFRVGLNIPGYGNGVYTTSDRAEAEQAAIGAIFCGAPYADINWMAGTVWHQQIWAEVS